MKIYLQKVGRLKQFQKLAGQRGWYLRSAEYYEARQLGYDPQKFRFEHGELVPLKR